MKRCCVWGWMLLAAAVLGACSLTGTQGPDWDENILVYASLSETETVQDQVKAFNKTHADVQIEVRDYSDEGGRDRLVTEILTGKVPDIIDLSQLPYRKLSQEGYLESLWPYIDGDPDLGRDAVMERPLRAAEIDGNLYTVFRSVMINTLAGKKSVVGSRYGWTTDDLLNAFHTMPEGSTITDYYATKDMMFNLIFRMNLDGNVDWKTGRCSFDNDSFRNALEFVNTFPLEYEWDPTNGGIEELRSRRVNGLQMLSMLPVRGLSDMQVSDLLYGEETAFIGYPAGEGCTGSSFVPAKMLAMSSVCRNKEAAWDFLRQTVLPRFDHETMKEAIGRHTTYLPINRKDYDLMVFYCQSEREPPQGVTRITAGSDGSTITLPPVSDGELSRFEDFYNSIDKIDLCDEEIYNIVWDQCGPYFAGDKSLDETVDLIQRRVSLYVNEQR